MRNIKKIIHVSGCLILLLFTTCKEKNDITNSNLLAPVITQISPDSGRFGTEVTITGTNFGATSQENTVTFNGLEAKVVRAAETELVAEVPKGAETGVVEVRVAGQSDTGPEYTYLLTPVVSTLAGTGQAGFDDGPGETATFNLPYGLTLKKGNQPDEDELLVADRFNGAVRSISTDGTVSTVVFNSKLDAEPIDLTTTGDNLAVTLYNRHVVSFVEDAGMGGFDYVQFAGTDNVAGYNDGQRDEARFNHPLGITTDDEGNFYVADRNNHSIRQLDPDDDEVRTFNGTNTPGYVDDGISGGNSRFNEPVFIRWIPNPPDCCGELFMSEAGNHTIRSIVVDGGGTGTVAGNGHPGFNDGTGDEAQFNSPRGIDFDEKGNLFVADFMNNAIRKITPEGVVTTVIKSEGEVSISEGPRLVDGPAGRAQFNGPYGIAVGSDGSLYFTDLYSYAVRKVTFE